jgi:hypothetical protein
MAKQNTDKLAKLFAIEYLSNQFNATKAYKYIKPHCSQRSCEVGGSKMLNSDEVKQIIAEIRGEQVTKHGITLESQLEDLARYKELALIGNRVGEPYLASAIKAVEVQNKMLGLNAVERVENININYDGASIDIEL